MAKDSEFLQGSGYQSSRRWTFGRAIRPATPALMADLLKESEAGGGQWSAKPPDYRSVRHAGIQENIGSLISHVHYCSGGDWYTLDYTGE